MKQRESVTNRVLNRLKNDYTFRTFLFSTLSFFVTVGFTGYHAYLGIAYHAAWNIGIGIYYTLLLCIRAYVIYSEIKLHKMQYTDKQKETARKKTFFVQSIILFVIDIALIAPITLMVLQQKSIDYSMIPAIAMAGYTTYKIIASSINFVKTRKERNASVKILRNINFKDALVSILSLQYTLIMTFDGGMDNDMFVLCAIVTFVVWVFLIVISILTVVKAIKNRKALR